MCNSYDHQIASVPKPCCRGGGGAGAAGAAGAAGGAGGAGEKPFSLLLVFAANWKVSHPPIPVDIGKQLILNMSLVGVLEL